MNTKWIALKDQVPPIGIEYLGYNPEWVDEDFNPKGVRVWFHDDLGWYSAKYNNTMDCWDTTEEEKPTHWMELPQITDQPKETVDQPQQNWGWWCEKCKRFVTPESVTFEETHDPNGGCGYPVISKRIDQPQAIKRTAEEIVDEWFHEYCEGRIERSEMIAQLEEYRREYDSQQDKKV